MPLIFVEVSCWYAHCSMPRVLVRRSLALLALLCAATSAMVVACASEGDLNPQPLPPLAPGEPTRGDDDDSPPSKEGTSSSGSSSGSSGFSAGPVSAASPDGGTDAEAGPN